MLVLHTRWTLWHHKMDAILSQFFPWMLVHHTRKSADFSKIPWSLVLHTSWMLFRHTRGWTFFLHTMDVKDGARLGSENSINTSSNSLSSTSYLKRQTYIVCKYVFLSPLIICTLRANQLISAISGVKKVSVAKLN